LHGKPCVLEGGEQTRDPTYCTDAVDAWVLGVEADPENVVGETFQVSFGKEFTARKMLEACIRACRRKVKVIEKDYRPGEKGMREQFDISKASKVLGYAPKVPLTEGLKLTTKWMQSIEA
jgi:nucleoside-diphosphate-sugar epimerase